MYFIVYDIWEFHFMFNQCTNFNFTNLEMAHPIGSSGGPSWVTPWLPEVDFLRAAPKVFGARFAVSLSVAENVGSWELKPSRTYHEQTSLVEFFWPIIW